MILAVLLVCILLGLFLPQYLITKYGYRNLTYSVRFSEEEVTEGDTVTLIETISNDKLLPLPWVKADLTTDASLLFATDQTAVSGDARFVYSYFCLFPRRKVERRWRVTCTKRGCFTVSHAVIVLSDLFGNAECSRPFADISASLTVLPAIRRSDAVQAFPQQLTGEVIRNRTLIPDRFAVCGIRPYADGDSVRDICWSATARADAPMVWQYQETAVPSLTVLLNLETRVTDRDHLTDKPAFEQAVRVCAAILGEAAKQRIPVRLCANSVIGTQPAETPFRSGDSALHGMLCLLAALPDTISFRCEAMLDHACAKENISSVILITPQPTDAILRYADAEPRLTVISARPLRESEIRRNVRHISIYQERIPKT